MSEAGLPGWLMMVGMSGQKLVWSSMRGQQKLVLSGALVMSAGILAFVAFTAVAGLSKASELAGVVSALVAFAGLGVAVGGALWQRAVDHSGAPVIRTAIGAGPWTIAGYGITYEVRSVTRSAKKRPGGRKRWITVTACVTRTKSRGLSDIKYRFRDEDSGKKLVEIDSERSGVRNPPLNEPNKLVMVFEDIDPPVNSLRISVRDFFWQDGCDLVLHEVPVSS